MRALRFLTAGSVDDGKSTLIGRLLFECRAILSDQLDALERRAAGAPIDLSLLTDGLEAEREQGITIDVAYRYFTTKKRKFIIADAPGHEQYTRNMVTAAAGSDAAVVLVDITKIDWREAQVHLLPQTRRHALLAQLLRVPSIVFAVNKLDTVTQADAATAFAAVRQALVHFCQEAGITAAGVVPVSALTGANVATPMAAPWYQGPSLLGLLEGLPNADTQPDGALVMPVQYVAREGGGVGEQPRIVWGRIARGKLRCGDAIQVFPSREVALVSELHLAGTRVESAHAGQSAGLVLDRQLDVSRGDWILAPHNQNARSHFSATLAWLDTEPAVVGRKYLLRHGNRWVHGRLAAIEHRLDVHTLQRLPSQSLTVNDIGLVRFGVQQPLPLQAYAHDRTAGALIVVDPSTHRTSGALLVNESEVLT